MNGLEDRSVPSDVSRRSETESTDETGAHIGEDVSVEVRGDEDGVGEGGGVLDDLVEGKREGGLGREWEEREGG